MYTPTRSHVAALAIGCWAITAALYGCEATRPTAGPTSAGPTTAPAPLTGRTAPAEPAAAPTFALFGPPPVKSGSQIWSENCMRCHNARQANTYSDAQWEIIVHHMQLRANLTGLEAREVTKFLQASN